jgi:ATP-binding protein involved in chromosome partitioning
MVWRGPMVTQALEQLLKDTNWRDVDYLIVDMPPGTGDIQMALSRLLPRAELLVVTTPALAAQKVAVRVADMARRSYLKVAGVVENMTAFTCDHGESYPLFGSGGGAALAEEVHAPLLAQIPLEPGVAAGGDAGSPLALAEPQSPAGQAFHLLAHRLATEIMPPVEMSGCTARIFAAAQANLAAFDAAKAAAAEPD